MSLKLYHGTTERIAKSAPTSGIRPYGDTPFSDQGKGTIQLTNIFTGLQALSASKADERWGIVEICWEKTLGKNLVGTGKRRWQETIDQSGMCLFRGAIPPRAVGKIFVFDPRSNWMVTRSALHLGGGSDNLKKHEHKLSVLHRWLTCEFFFIEEWLGPELNRFTRQERDAMADMLGNRSGLDVFHH